MASWTFATTKDLLEDIRKGLEYGFEPIVEEYEKGKRYVQVKSLILNLDRIIPNHRFMEYFPLGTRSLPPVIDKFRIEPIDFENFRATKIETE